MEGQEPWQTDQMVLGWKVDGDHPVYWTDSKASPGKHKLEHVLLTQPKTSGHHAVIVAQSGSGKSYFLGRILEEILIKTKSRVLILDPNADFRKIAHAKAAKYWTDPKEFKYDDTSGKGFLADEQSREDFLTEWDPVSKVLYSRRGGNGDDVEILQLDWLKLPIEFLLDEADESLRDEIRHCHSLVNTLAELAVTTGNESWLKEGKFLQDAENFWEDTLTLNEDAIAKHVKSIFSVTTRYKSQVKRGSKVIELPKDLPTLDGFFLEGNKIDAEVFDTLVRRAAVHRKFVQETAKRFYFGRASEIQKSGLIDPEIRRSFERSRKRVQVVDLPSIADGRHQKMVMSAFVEAEWSFARTEWERALDSGSPNADKRVPTFIVVDEAHNAIPSIAESIAERKLQEQFRRIAAEGRKYGLFLILVSQRPDKLDRMVVSECENRAVMKLGSRFILKTTCEVLGLEGQTPEGAPDKVPDFVNKVLNFSVGRALLIGPWAGAEDHATLISAARRTEEGGRDLRSEHWASRANRISVENKSI